MTDAHRGKGIIPACAGSTSFLRGLLLLPADHPRMRGEHFTTILSLTATEGSSPHARGALLECSRNAAR